MYRQVELIEKSITDLALTLKNESYDFSLLNIMVYNGKDNLNKFLKFTGIKLNDFFISVIFQDPWF